MRSGAYTIQLKRARVYFNIALRGPYISLIHLILCYRYAIGVAICSVFSSVWLHNQGQSR
jgi:hypothetical protein